MLVRVSAVSKSWYRFVIENGLCKQLCFKMFPEISDVIHSIEMDDMIEPVSNMLEGYRNWEFLKRSHKAYALLAFDLSPYVKNCILEAVVASSTNIDPEESIQNTLEPGDRTDNRPSYWLSKGHTSPHYQMFQENRLQVFKLPKPVLCNGRVLLVELLGRAQKQGLLYYIGISHVQAVGLPILAAFKEIIHPSGKYTLEYCPSISVCPSFRALYSSSSSSSWWMKYGIIVMFLPLAHLMIALTDN